jgi:hypothetical protein
MHGRFSPINLLPIIRVITLCTSHRSLHCHTVLIYAIIAGLSFVLASIVIGLSAHLTSFTVAFDEQEAKTSALLAVATASLTIVTLPGM